MKRIAALTLLTLLYSLSVNTLYAQNNPHKEYISANSIDIFNKYVNYIYASASISADDLESRGKAIDSNFREEVIILTAKFFLGTPYVAHTLEKEPEGLVINLEELDCTTFMENVIVLATCFIENKLDFENYKDLLKRYRYRDGRIEDYSSRLHYTTDWFYHNQKNGFIKDITKECNGVPFIKELNIISKNPDKYKQLKNNMALVKKIELIEKEINKREHYYIPKNIIEKSSNCFRSGDLVGFATNIEGLDLTHVGIIYKQGDKLTFIHASSTQKKVVVEEKGLTKYCMDIKSNIGIMVARMIDNKI